MRHSISFHAGGQTRNTLTDWKLLQEELPTFAPPKIRTNMIELPGVSGMVDLTETVTGYPLYQNREGSLEFLTSNPRVWRSTYNEIMEFLHGQAMEAVLEDEPDWYYSGRFWVDTMACDVNRGTIVIGYSVDPYKWARQASTEPWKWDTFSFVDGVIYNGIYIDDTQTPSITYHNAGLFSDIEVGHDLVSLALTAQATGSAPLSVVFHVTGNDVSISANKGTHTVYSQRVYKDQPAALPGLVLYNGKWLYSGQEVSLYAVEAEISATSNAGLMLSFRAGRL